MSDESIISWREEAEFVINDVREFVDSIAISYSLQSNNRCIYLNIKTFEGNEICVELSGLGFRVVGNQYDNNTIISEDYFDTPYSLLSSLSPSYETKFAASLADKLNELSE